MGVESDKKDFDLAYVLFDLILNVHSTIFQVCGTGLPGLNQYQARIPSICDPAHYIMILIKAWL